jgi:hypothetical protein
MPQTQPQIAKSNRHLVDQEMIDMPPRKIKDNPNKMMEEVVEDDLEKDKDNKKRLYLERKKSQAIRERLSDQDETTLPLRERNRLLLKRHAQMIELAK